ncbi:MAG: hypothetical protein HY521_12135 [Proteobacteria bacterium]|nr:hypothetical protein [Pseudomonadota bacterium]
MAKVLKSSLQDLRQIFERSLTVRHLAEPFVTFDETRSDPDIKEFMVEKDFDVVGVRREGVVVGYVKSSDLTDQTLQKHITPFERHLLVDETVSIPNALRLLRESPRVFVVVMGYVAGIATKGDLQKAPVRMYLFGILSLIEMQLLRLIREVFRDEAAWKGLLTNDRIGQATKLLAERRQRNEAIDLADCLQFGDKATIVKKCQKLREALGFRSGEDARSGLKSLRELRDELAHSQDIITARWPGLIDLLKSAEDVLERAEKYVERRP